MTQKFYRLMTADADLAERLRASPPDVLARAALAACDLAISESGLQEPLVLALMASLKRGDAVQEQRELESLVETLDNHYFDLKDLFDVGKASEQQYVDAYEKARAAMAVLWLFIPDPIERAMEVFYEVTAAGVTVDVLRQVLERTTQQLMDQRTQG